MFDDFQSSELTAGALGSPDAMKALSKPELSLHREGVQVTWTCTLSGLTRIIVEWSEVILMANGVTPAQAAQFGYRPETQWERVQGTQTFVPTNLHLRGGPSSSRPMI
jgi:hypothetical protein